MGDEKTQKKLDLEKTGEQELETIDDEELEGVQGGAVSAAAGFPPLKKPRVVAPAPGGNKAHSITVT